MSAILLVPPAIEPVTVAQAKSFLRVEHDDDDPIIAALIAGSRIHVEAQTRRALIAQRWRLSRDGWPVDGRIAVLPAPLRALLAVRVYREDGTTRAIDPGLFAVDTSSAPAVLAASPGQLPSPARLVGGIEFDIEAGYGEAVDDVPAPLRQAILLLVAHWYENRGVVAVGDAVAALPANVGALIAPFRVLSL
jgi:uncharacterized phiE125 gp8 family phage protein